MSSAKGSYTSVPNELLEAMYQTDNHFSPNQMRVLLYLIRMTYGWHKARDRISLKRMSADIGKDRRNVTRAVRELERMGVIEVDRPGQGQLADISINLPDEWGRATNMRRY